MTWLNLLYVSAYSVQSDGIMNEKDSSWTFKEMKTSLKSDGVEALNQ